MRRDREKPGFLFLELEGVGARESDRGGAGQRAVQEVGGGSLRQQTSRLFQMS